MPIWPFQPSRASADAALLLDAVGEASRRPAFFAPGRTPDTLEGRFELMTLNSALALIRLQAEPGAGPLAQAFTDKLFRQFDAGLREAGVGDLTVPKRMRKLAGSFYGRFEAYAGAIKAVDNAALADALARNIGVSADFAEALASYAARAAKKQAGEAIEALFSVAGWPPLAA